MRVYQHSNLMLSQHVQRRGSVVITGTLAGEFLLRDFGYVVDGGTVPLLPPATASSGRVHAFLAIPGIPDRQAFLAQCRDENGHSPLDHFHVMRAPYVENYQDRARRASYGGK